MPLRRLRTIVVLRLENGTVWLNREMPFARTLEQIRHARELLPSYLPRTRLVSTAGIFPAAAQVHLKLETELPTGSFKPRGALFALAKNARHRAIHEVTASSTDNNSPAVAWAAKTLGMSATIFLPANPHSVKRKNIAALGARIVEAGALRKTLCGQTLTF